MYDTMQYSFSLNIRILHILGLYPSKSHPNLQKAKAYIGYLALMITVTSLVSLKIILSTSTENLRVNAMTVYLASCFCFWFKLVPFIRNGERIKKCVDYFGAKFFAARGEEEKKNIKHCVQVCQGMSWGFLVIIFVAEAYWILPPLFQHRLPLDAWLPYDPSGPLAFYATFIYFSAAPLYAGLCGGFTDPLIGGLAYQATVQLKILKYNLENLYEQILEQYTDKNTDHLVTFEKAYSHLNRCVFLHNHILQFVSEYEDCFSLCLISQIAGCTIGLCFCCLGLIVSTTNFEAIENLILGLVLICQIFFYCYFGTLLIEENYEFITAIYMSRWYNYDTDIRKLLILMMERSKQPMIVRAGKIVDLTLRTFTSILKTSYSLIAVFKS